MFGIRFRNGARYRASLTSFAAECKQNKEGERSSAATTYFWNEKFQEIMDMDDGYVKYNKLRNLAHDFTHAASV